MHVHAGGSMYHTLLVSITVYGMGTIWEASLLPPATAEGEQQCNTHGLGLSN
jgi:hypothetical protein